MAADSKIEWCDHTFNPWIGCTKVSQEATGGGGCDGCYAAVSTPVRVLRGKGIETWGAHAPRHRTSAANWSLPKRWDAQHEAFFARHGYRQRVFCASLADVFDNAVPLSWLHDLFDVIAATPNLDWLLLTKRIGNVKARLYDAGWPVPLPDNVWLGATVVNQAEADRDIPKLLNVPAAKRFLSMEPLLGPVDLTKLSNPGPLHRPGAFINALRGGTYGEVPGTGERMRITHGPLAQLDWVIVGGESGPGARPMHPDWARGLRDQCVSAGVPFLFKQWGEHDLSYDRDRDDPDYRRCDHVAKQPGRWINLAGGHGFNGERVHYAHRVSKKAAGRLLDGREWNEVPR